MTVEEAGLNTVGWVSRFDQPNLLSSINDLIRPIAP